MTRLPSSATICALAAVTLWSTLAWLGVRLAAVPPFLLVGSALAIAGLAALPTVRRWRVRASVLALGVYGLFGFHLFLFVALRLAPPLPANLVNYLWPLLIVVLAPAFVGTRLGRWHVAGAALGLAGAVVAITNGNASRLGELGGARAAWGYAAAFASACVWATYSLGSQRLRRRGAAFPTAAVGGFCLVSAALALACHASFEPSYAFTARDVVPLVALGLGPMGAAFFLWDAALARGDARALGTLAYLTPVLSTMLLATADPSRLGWPLAAALALVVGGAALGQLAPQVVPVGAGDARGHERADAHLLPPRGTPADR